MEDILTQVLKKAKQEGISIYKLSKETGIAKEKLYKWVDPKVKAKPKTADEKILSQWLNSGIVAADVASTSTTCKKKPREESRGGFLIDAGASLVRSEAKLDVLLSAVAELMANSVGRSVTSVREDLEAAVRTRIDTMEAGLTGL